MTDTEMIDWLGTAVRVDISRVLVDHNRGEEIEVTIDHSTGYGKNIRAAIRDAALSHNDINYDK
mgnify:CR=1 FL=1